MVMPQRAIRELAEIGRADPSAEEISAAKSAAALAAAIEGKVGERLRAARQAAGYTLVDVFDGTKVKIGLLDAIETGDRKQLPATPYAAGFVKSYAQFLGLDPNAYAALYRAEVAAEEAAKAALSAAAPLPAAKAPVIYEAPIIADPVPEKRQAAAPGVCATAPPAAPFAETAPSPANVSPEKLVSYFGIGASLVVAGWIGAMIASPKNSAAPAPMAKIDVRAETPALPPPVPVIEKIAAAPAPKEVAAEAPAVEAETEPVVTFVVTAGPRLKPPAPKISPAADHDVAEIDAGALNAAQKTQIAEIPPAPAAAPSPKRAPKVTPASLMRPAAPKYPERCASRAAKRETVDVVIDIDANGVPRNARVGASSNECFNIAALQTAARMRFSPATVDGAPNFEAAKSMTIEFLK